MKYIPTEKEIEKMLKDSSPRVSPRLERRLANAPWTPRAVAGRRMLSAAFAMIAVVALLIAVLPQGRALAQSALQFFTRAENDTYSVPFDYHPTFEETTQFHETCGIAIFPQCSVEQIRGMVDFEVKEIGVIPDALYFVGSTGGPDFVELKYGYDDRLDGNLSIVVEAVGRPSAIGTGIAAKSADIESVQIGDLPAEFYKGVLFQDDQGNVTWQPDDPTLTLRWQDGGSIYTLVYYSVTLPLTKEDLVAMAATMTTEPVVKKPLPPGFIR